MPLSGESGRSWILGAGEGDGEKGQGRETLKVQTPLKKIPRVMAYVCAASAL